MADSLYRDDYCTRCGNNHVMWFEGYYRRFVIGCQQCGTQVTLLSEVGLSTLPDSNPTVQLYHRMVEHGRLVEVGGVVAHG